MTCSDCNDDTMMQVYYYEHDKENPAQQSIIEVTISCKYVCMESEKSWVMKRAL